MTEFDLPHPGSQPWGITIGPDGAVWFAEVAGNRLGRISRDGWITECALAQGSIPTDLVTGSDRNLWFTENATNRIARLTIP